MSHNVSFLMFDLGGADVAPKFSTTPKAAHGADTTASASELTCPAATIDFAVVAWPWAGVEFGIALPNHITSIAKIKVIERRIAAVWHRG